MKSKRAIILAVVVLAFPQLMPASGMIVGGNLYELRGSSWYVRDSSGGWWEVYPGRMKIRFHSSTTAGDRLACESVNSVWRSNKPISAAGYFRYKYEASRDPVDVLRSVLASPAVEDAHLSTWVKYTGDPNDTYFADQWNIGLTGVDAAWDSTTGSSNVSIAVLDDGVDYNHEDLAANIWVNPNEIPGNGIDDDGDGDWAETPLVDDVYGWDFVDGDNDPRPALSDKHGTAVAGICAAVRDNSLGVAGVAGGSNGVGPRVVSLRVPHDESVAEAVEYCWRKGINVINMSIEVFDQDGEVAAQLDSAWSHGTLMVASAGNSGEFGIPDLQLVRFPASHPAVVAVGATDSSDERLTYSCYGPNIEIMAPSGEGYEPPTPPTPIYIFTTDNYQIGASYNPEHCLCPAGSDRYFSKFNGTSASAPQVAGIAALLLSHNPSHSNEDVRMILRASACDLDARGFDELTGYGRVDAAAAISAQLVSGTLTSNTTWSGVVVLTGDIVVASGVQLTVAEGTTVAVIDEDRDQTGFDASKIELNVEGSIAVNGTDQNPVRFYSLEGRTTDWLGIYFDGQSSGGSLTHAYIEHAEYGIESYVPLTINNLHLENCAYAGVVFQGGASSVSNADIVDCGAWGVYNASPAPDVVSLNNCLVENATGAAFQVKTGAIFDLSAVEARNSAIGVYVSSGATTSIGSGSVFVGNGTGVHGFNATLVLVDSRSDSNTVEGLFCDSNTDATVSNCAFDANHTGILALDNSDPVIRDSRMRNNVDGVSCASGSRPDLGSGGDPGNNTVTGSSDKHLVNLSPTVTVSAILNWWGTYPPKAKKFVGAVDYVPALDTAPAMVVQLGETPARVAPQRDGILGVAPNPFNPAVAIRYGVSTTSRVRLNVFDVAGRLVDVLVDRQIPSGEHLVEWDGKGQLGQRVPSGIYFAQITVNGVVQTRKLALLK